MEVMRYDLSMDDCNVIVRADPAISDEIMDVIKYELERVPGQPGYLGAYNYLTIYYKTSPETIKCGRYFMKSLPYHDTVLTEAVEEWGIFRKEAELYRELFHKYERNANKVIKWAPDCLLARNQLLVMADLTSAGYRTIEFQNSLNKQHMELVFDRLAQMHACSLHFEITHLEGKSIEAKYGDKILFETTFTPTSSWFVAGLKGIQKVALERNHHSNDPLKKTIIENQLWTNLERIYTLAESTNEFRSVVVHRDLWVNNIMFKYDHAGALHTGPKDCVLVDFQLARYLPPAVDYLSALYLLTDHAHRTQHVQEYEAYYYGSLQRKLTLLGLNGAEILPWEEFQQTLQHYRLLALVWTGVLHGFVNFPKGLLDRLHHEDPHTYTRMSMENRDDFVMKYYDSDAFYRARFNDVVTELLEFLFDFR
uniref:CHK kinase-like domain-containing protein n=1 Tax=Anopheles culicifacies TaxID=139723 RepID=A0A182MFI5_9DIPT